MRPSGHSTGGARRYSNEDVGRIVHIRELQSLLGFDLGEIGEVLRGEDELDGLRSEYRSGADAGAVARSSWKPRPSTSGCAAWCGPSSTGWVRC